MITTWRADRSARYASACAVACAVVCASVSAAVLLSLLWTSPSSLATNPASEPLPLISATACEDERAAEVLSRVAERDVRWRGSRDVVRWGDWRVLVGAERLPVRAAVAVVLPSRTSIRRVAGGAAGGSSRERKADRRADEGWRISDAPSTARLAVGVSYAIGDTVGVVSPGGIAAAVERNALLTRNGRVARCTPGSRPSDLAPDTLRDRRLAMGVRADGALIFVLAHFDGVGEQSALARLGPTRTELGMLLKALGAERGAELSTGSDAQLLVRDRNGGEERRWNGAQASAYGLLVESVDHTARVDAGDLVTPR